MPYTPTDELAHYEGARADALSSYRNLLAERDAKLRTARTTHGPGVWRWGLSWVRKIDISVASELQRR